MRLLRPLLLLLWPMTLAAQTPIAGFNFPAWRSDAYSSPQAQQSLANLAATGARWVALTPTHYMRDGRSSGIFATASTPTDDSLRAAIRQARGLGLHVALKPHVDIQGALYRIGISPRDPDAWFASYERIILRYADLAQQEGAELFVVGTELSSVAQPIYKSRWERLIAGVRARYHGKLTYAAIAYEYPRVPFWGSLDYVGVDGYFPMPGGHNPAALRAGWRDYAAPLWIVSRLTGKPVLFTEIGLSSQSGANHRPWDFGRFGKPDDAVQANYLKAFLDVMAKQGFFAGFLYWDWDVDSAAGGPTDRGMTVQGKPALDVLSRYFRAAAAPPPLPASRLNAPAARRRAFGVPAPF